jgi:hypothetical protein
LKTLALSEPTSFEIAQAMLGRGGDPSSLPAYGASSDPFLQKLHELQTSSARSPHGKRHVATQAAVHAAALPPVPPAISKPLPEDELANLFGMPIEARK